MNFVETVCGRWLCVLVFLGATGLTNAAPYVGVDAVSMDSKVKFQGFGKEEYDTTHLRLKGGITPLHSLSFELQILTNKDDQTTDSAGDLFRFKTGNVLAVFAKPHVTAGPANIYGLLGYARTRATYTDVAIQFSGNATIGDVAFGLGAEFGAATNLKVSMDYISYFKKNVDFNRFFPSDLEMKAIGLGVNYSFK